MIVAVHRAEQPLMTQVGYGIGDISTAEKRQLAAGADVTPPRWPDSAWGQVAAAAWLGRCDVFTDFLAPVLRDCAGSVTYPAGADAADSASRLSDIAFRTCLADRDGPVDLIARGLAALWFERDLTRLAGTLPRDLESSETALSAVVRRRTDPRAETNANSGGSARAGSTCSPGDPHRPLRRGGAPGRDRGHPGGRGPARAGARPDRAGPRLHRAGRGAPLLLRARALAERLGIAVPDSAAAIDEASLDIDV